MEWPERGSGEGIGHLGGVNSEGVNSEGVHSVDVQNVGVHIVGVTSEVPERKSGAELGYLRVV